MNTEQIQEALQLLHQLLLRYETQLEMQATEINDLKSDMGKVTIILNNLVNGKEKK